MLCVSCEGLFIICYVITDLHHEFDEHFWTECQL